MKQCRLCGFKKSLANFNKKDRGFRSECRKCQSVISAKYRSSLTQEQYDRRKRNTRESELIRLYGINFEQLEALAQEQCGVCLICKRECQVYGGYRTFHVDHSHLTGAVRGLLCADCNRALGFLRDDPALLRAAADYFEQRLTT